MAQATKYCIAYDNIVGSRVTPPRKCKTKGDWAREGVDVDKLLRVAPRLKPTAAAQATKYCIAYDNIVGSRVTPPRKCRTKRDWAKEGVDVDKLLKG